MSSGDANAFFGKLFQKMRSDLHSYLLRFLKWVALVMVAHFENLLVCTILIRGEYVMYVVQRSSLIAGLSAEEQTFVTSMTSMGFDQGASVRAMQKYGLDDKEVLREYSIFWFLDSWNSSTVNRHFALVVKIHLAISKVTLRPHDQINFRKLLEYSDKVEVLSFPSNLSTEYSDGIWLRVTRLYDYFRQGNKFFVVTGGRPSHQSSATDRTGVCHWGRTRRPGLVPRRREIGEKDFDRQIFPYSQTD